MYGNYILASQYGACTMDQVGVGARKYDTRGLNGLSISALR